MLYFSKTRILLISLFTLIFVYLTLSNFIKIENNWHDKKINLGLDLQGGSYLLIEVDTKSVITENIETFSDNFRTILRKNKISYKKFNIQDQIFSFSLRDENKKNDLLKILSKYEQDASYESNEENLIHVSGHPAKEELSEMYSWVRPNTLIAVHGEARHINAHVKHAKEQQISNALAGKNGFLIKLSPGDPRYVGELESVS